MPNLATLPLIAQPNLSANERILSALLAVGLLAAGVPRRRWLAASAGTALLLRAGTGYCPVTHAIGRDDVAAARRQLSGRKGTHVRVQTTIGQPPATVYAFWRDPERLARALPDTLRVRRLDDVHSHWTLLTGNRRTLATWTAKLINDVPDRVLAWQTTGDSAVVSAGSATFAPAPGDQGTEVRIHLQFAPPLGRLGAGLATLSGHDAVSLTKQGLDDIKRFLELGRVMRLSAG
jgi:uncharacterized membrane protein